MLLPLLASFLLSESVKKDASCIRIGRVIRTRHQDGGEFILHVHAGSVDSEDSIPSVGYDYRDPRPIGV